MTASMCWRSWPPRRGGSCILSVSKAPGSRENTYTVTHWQQDSIQVDRDHAVSLPNAPWKLSVPRHDKPKSNQVRTWSPRGMARHCALLVILDPNGIQVVQVLRGSEPVLSCLSRRHSRAQYDRVRRVRPHPGVDWGDRVGTPHSFAPSTSSSRDASNSQYRC